MNDSLNEKTVTLKVKRIDLVNILIGLNSISIDVGEASTKWSKLHDKLRAKLDEFDAKQAE